MHRKNKQRKHNVDERELMAVARAAAAPQHHTMSPNVLKLDGNVEKGNIFDKIIYTLHQKGWRRQKGSLFDTIHAFIS